MNELCFDIGGSKYITGLVNDQGEVLCAERREWDELTPKGVIASLIASGRQLLAAHPEYAPDVIGVTIPGLAKAEEGLWVEASFSGIRDLPIGRLLREAFGLPVYGENDAKACALAEKLFGAAKHVSHFLYLTVSNGVGGAVFSDGRLLYGSGAAGECGHVTVVENGRLCKCGKNGCLEAYAAGPGLTRTYEELSGIRADGEHIAGLARRGETAALEAFRLEGVYLGRMIGMAVNLLSPDKVIIGGGLSLAFDLFEHSLAETVAGHVYRSANPAVTLTATPLGYYGGLLGAAALALCGPEQRYGYHGKAV
ncbi:MAG: ROK family protein [Eubacteriales bacterium]|nr:ROK family protein [Eubacteriales bacterium]